MESEKKAVRDFEGPEMRNFQDAKSRALFPSIPGIEKSKSDSRYHLSSTFHQFQKIEIPEPKLPDSQNEMTNGKHTNIPATAEPIASDKTPAGTIEPNTEELQNIKNMILILQLELQEERSKREILEEKMRKLEGNSALPSLARLDTEWQIADNRGTWTPHENPTLNSDGNQNQPVVPPINRNKSIHEKIGDLSSEFDLKLQNLDNSLSEMRSILANNLVCALKGDKKIEAWPSENKDYNTFLYRKLERGIFPRQCSLKNALVKSLGELLNKP
jgi:hypothetical protein